MRRVISWGESAQAGRWRRRTRLGLIGGVVGLVIVGCLLSPIRPFEPAVLGSQAVPDLDEDGKPDTLLVASDRRQGAVLRLSPSREGARDHDVLALGPVSAPRFEPDGRPEGQGRRWRVLDGGQEVARVLLVGQPGKAAPDLVAFAGERAKRYVFIERGFLKLDAFEIIPGFSAGLVMVGDRREVLEGMGGAIKDDGRWVLPLATPMRYTVMFDVERRVERVMCHSSRLQTNGQLGIGDTAKAIAARWPGERKGAAYFAPRYGIVAHLGPDDKITSMTVMRPWRDAQPKTR